MKPLTQFNKPEQTLKTDLIDRLIANNLTPLHEEIKTLRSLWDSKSKIVTEFQIKTIDHTIPCDETLEIVKSIPQFSEKPDNYVLGEKPRKRQWDFMSAKTRRYFVALTILRNKIVTKANDALTNHGTALNFVAILARLDFVFSDKRPIYIIEQKLSVFTQNRFSVLDFYNLVNIKLTLLINETIMTGGKEIFITSVANLRHTQSPLRVFITGLNGPISGMLFSLNPSDLPNALARVQEMESNQMRAQFVYHFCAPQGRNILQYNLFNQDIKPFQQPEQAVKRAQIESSAQPRNKQMRINNIKEEHFLGEQ